MPAYDTGILNLVKSLHRGGASEGYSQLSARCPHSSPGAAALRTVFVYTGRLPPVLPNTNPITEGARERERESLKLRASGRARALFVVALELD